MMRAGWSEIEWTPAPGLPLLGQMNQRFATHARDPLCSVALALQNAETTVVIVACDVCVLDNAFVRAAQQRFSAETGHEATSLLIHATHTHVAPISTGALMEEPLSEFEAVLQDSVLRSAHAALAALEPVEIFAARGFLQELGWNRRAMFEDGSAQMYGHSEMPGFRGMEGPRDGDLPLLWTRNAAGVLTGVLAGFATHPNCLESECFYSADLPGGVRKNLRKLFGEKIGALYLTGAAGNTAPSVLDPHDAAQPWRGESGVERSACYLVGEAAKVLASTLEPMKSDTLALAHEEVQIPMRDWPRRGEPTFPLFDNTYYEKAAALWPQLLQQESPFSVRVTALRIGEALVCTNPAELFVEFGLQIKHESPASVTFISQLTDGYCGYVPTAKAFAGGGYETWCAPSSRLDPKAGDEIVAATKRMMQRLYPDSSA